LDDKLGIKEQRTDDSIEKFAESESFRTAKQNFSALEEYRLFSAAQMDRIMTAALKNKYKSRHK
jgi:hypothetical protein